jgi:hypothetical protein
MRVSRSFKAALVSYAETPHPASEDGRPPRLSPADIAHLKRWADDDRADEVWNTISRAAQEHRGLLPVQFFIQEILGARDIAQSLNHRRKHRDRYRKRAAQMVEIAKVLREPLPNGLLLIPSGVELARKVDDAAQKYREYVAASRNLPGVIKWTRESKPPEVFMSLLSNDLKGITGRWLDQEVAVLTQIAFGDPDFDKEQVFWVRRRVNRSKAVGKSTR